MALWFSGVVAAPALLLLSAVFVTSGWANQHVAWVRRAAVVLLSIACGCAVGASAWLVAWGPLDVIWLAWDWPIPMNLGVYFDNLAAVMASLISFIGLVIVRYSSRYLDGEVTQGRFLRWIMVTLGAVMAMVISRNLVMFTVAWMLTSLGLHQLLTHYPDRTWAIWAARKKFLISRLGDLLLVAALVLTFYCFGSFDYRVVFDAAPALADPDQGSSWLVSVIGGLFVMGAMTKSAQFPFHSWLPDTMETPTPVSALMHAGVINAGGFLVIRLSPLLSQCHAALGFLAMVGAFTALLGGLVMLTQTSIKRALAYSTIAQMGFMMLQCGLGAFSAALLHIVAHSLYKAHAFLSSGSVLDAAARANVSMGRVLTGLPAAAALLVALLVAILTGGASVWFWGIDLGSKPGAIALGLIFVLALTYLIWQAFLSASARVAARGVAWAALISWLYLGGWLAMDWLLAIPTVDNVTWPSPLDSAVIGFVALGFTAVFALQIAVGRSATWPLFRALYVHAVNGFYLDIPARRITARVWGDQSPTP